MPFQYQLVFVATHMEIPDVVVLLEIKTRQRTTIPALEYIVKEAIKRWLVLDETGQMIARECGDHITLANVVTFLDGAAIESLRPYFQAEGILGFKLIYFDEVGDLDAKL